MESKEDKDETKPLRTSLKGEAKRQPKEERKVTYKTYEDSSDNEENGETPAPSPSEASTLVGFTESSELAISEVPVKRLRGQRGKQKPKSYEIEFEKLVEAIPQEKLVELYKGTQPPKEKKPRSEKQMESTAKLIALQKAKKEQRMKAENPNPEKVKVSVQPVGLKVPTKGKIQKELVKKVSEIETKVKKNDEFTKVAKDVKEAISKLPDKKKLTMMEGIKQKLMLRYK